MPRNESETRAELIDPLLAAAGWGTNPDARILREYKITKGRLLGAGRHASPDIAGRAGWKPSARPLQSALS